MVMGLLNLILGARWNVNHRVRCLTAGVFLLKFCRTRLRFFFWGVFRAFPPLCLNRPLWFSLVFPPRASGPFPPPFFFGPFPPPPGPGRTGPNPEDPNGAKH